jgi:CheY-like chemotaxis protein
VLVVDDDPDNASILAELLGDEGYEVEVARDGAGARERIERKRFDAAFLDALLPDCSGWDLARELRERSPQALLAMVTGADVRGQNRQSLALVDAVFRKPVDVGALDDFLRQPPEERHEGHPADEGARLPH